MASSSMVSALSRFPSWVPQSSAVVNILLMFTSFGTATVLGYDGSMMNALNILPSYTDYFELTAATTGLNSAMIWIGACFGGAGLAKLPDHIGRKPSLFWAAVVAMVGAALQAAAQNIGMFLAARFILGFGIGGTYVAAPLFLSEALPTKYRAIGLGALTDLYYVGGLLSSGITYGTARIQSTWAWRLPSLLQILFTLVSVVTLPFVPESPRFLAFQGRKDEALAALAQISADGDISAPAVQAQFLQIAAALDFEKNTTPPPTAKELVTNPSLRKRVLILLSTAVFSMLTGSNIFSYYLGAALDSAGITDATTQLEVNIILNAFCLAASVAGTALADRLGRKPLGALSTGACAAALFVIGALTRYHDPSTTSSSSSTAPVYANVAMMFLAQGAYSFGWTPLSLMYPPEVLGYRLRSAGLAAFTVCQNLVTLVPLFAYPVAIARIGWVIYVLNGVWDLFELAVVVGYWVETKGCTLEEADALFDRGKRGAVVQLVPVAGGGHLGDGDGDGDGEEAGSGASRGKGGKEEGEVVIQG